MTRLMSTVRPSRRRFAPPQDEELLYVKIKTYLILRSPRSLRLEGRKALIPTHLGA